MDKKEFEKWVDYVVKQGLNMPLSLFAKGFEDWNVRALLARALSRQVYNQPEPAKELFYSLVNIEVSLPEDIENKAWCLRDLGMCIWYTEKDANKALKYIDMGIRLAESIPDKFSFLTRGELWYDRWQLVSNLEQTEKAVAEADQRIAERDPKLKNNSYLYHAFRFKADIAHKKGDIDQALQFLHQALLYFPDDYENMGKTEELWRNQNHDKQKTYTEMEELTHYTELSWEI